MKSRCLGLFSVLCSLCALDHSNATTQSGAPDAASFMRTAADANTLTAPDMKPWHLRGNYQQLDEESKVIHEGTFEIWWAGPESSKHTFISREFTRTEYRAGKFTYFKGARSLWVQMEVEKLLLDPLFVGASANIEKDLTFGGAVFQCYFNGETSSSQTDAFCFKDTAPAIRLEISTHAGAITSQTNFNGIVKLHEHYLAKRIQLYEYGTLVIKLEVEAVDSALGIDEAELKPPADATLLSSQNLNHASGVIAGFLIRQKAPEYPSAGHLTRAQGTVVLGGLINKVGTLENLEVVTGPKIFQQAALDAVKTWRYQPFMLNGQPIEVWTQINVVFSAPTH